MEFHAHFKTLLLKGFGFINMLTYVSDISCAVQVRGKPILVST